MTNEGLVLEDVLLTSVTQRVNFCFLCQNDKAAINIQREVVSAQCVHLWFVQEGAFFAELRLEGEDQVPFYARDFRNLCEKHRESIKFIRFTFMENSRDFTVEDFVAA